MSARRLRAVIKLAEQHGWTYDVARTGHHRFTPPPGEGYPVLFASTPSDPRSDLNSFAELRRQGLPIIRKNHKKKADR